MGKFSSGKRIQVPRSRSIKWCVLLPRSDNDSKSLMSGLNRKPCTTSAQTGVSSVSVCFHFLLFFGLVLLEQWSRSFRPRYRWSYLQDCHFVLQPDVLCRKKICSVFSSLSLFSVPVRTGSLSNIKTLEAVWAFKSSS